ncbi:glycosyltransferase [Brevibacterium sp. UCMA 11752]|uniref:glycosyltransferase n=1 Tax=Brevibacterium sp. UCMA 11752 TaxID=2745946 RepID=UPI001F1F75DC|nr:glycosyltransferase [Brevibacterium sp. UCMA 11752]MCF2587188.1 glycosyltransferase [Brevibacterium sp. UCMA 11752]
MKFIPKSPSIQPKYPHRFPHRGVLPEGHYYTLTWGISYDFGGMTTVALERSSAFARQDNRQVEILTLSAELKDQDRERELRAEGRIDRRVHLRNIWKDLTSWSDRKLRKMVGTSELDHTAINDVLKRSGSEWTEIRRDSDENDLQVDRYRDSGALLVSDRLDLNKRGIRGGRRISLFDREQNVIAQWSTARALYQAWLDVVIGSKPSYLISDSSFAGGLVVDYRRDNVILCQVVHNHFLDNPNGSNFGELTEGKFSYMRRLDSFDVVTTLTDQQRHDMEEAALSDRFRTVSNLTEKLKGDPSTPRVRKLGAMVARLVPQKRVEDAIRAIDKASAQAPGVTLDVYGEGEDRPELADLIDGIGITDSVRMHGHIPGAKINFRTSAFSLLTSRFEGQGLVILESMSAGCIPICYAIDYGPTDIIEDGVNGFVVPPGDVDALAQAILRFLSMPEDEVEKMRRAAMARAADFYEAPIIRRWGEVLNEQSFEPIVHLDRLRAALTEATSTDENIDVIIDLESLEEYKPDSVYISWKSRIGNFYGRVEASFDDGVVRATIPTSRLLLIPNGYLDISVDLVSGRSFNRARIKSDNSNICNLGDSFRLYTTKHANLSGQLLQSQYSSNSSSHPLLHLENDVKDYA